MMKTFYIWILISAAVFGAGTLRIHLPDEKTLETDQPKLADVVLLAGDEDLKQKAGNVKLGQFSAAGQNLLIDRQTILSCLAAAGIPATQVQFSGADMTRTLRLETTIPAERFIETARLFLENSFQDQKPVSLKMLRSVQDFVSSSPAAEIELSARLSSQPNRGVHRVTVAVLQRGIEIGHQELTFAAQYECRRPVAMRRLETGTEITPENAKLETYLSSSPQPEAVSIPYGMMTRKIVPAGNVLDNSSVESRIAPALIKKQQQVVLKIETDVMQISAYGEAMDDGKPGDLIRVRRGSRATNDERFVIGRVMPDGTVQPALN